MRIGPKYKIARRLGVSIFDKTQTQKFVLSQSRKEKGGRAFSRPKSDFGIQMLEKQKARFMYGLSERQFSKYAKFALAKKRTGAVSELFYSLELRADNVVYRAGFAPSRLAARQLVSHGHILVNGKRITVPSYRLSVNDTVSVREGSLLNKYFSIAKEKVKEKKPPTWLSLLADKLEVKVESLPVYDPRDLMFDINLILEFYSR
ncbi:MAG TPA: 30S ribosomal protein S4 [Candidatus Paceibacterota bacterium]